MKIRELLEGKKPSFAVMGTEKVIDVRAMSDDERDEFEHNWVSDQPIWAHLAALLLGAKTFKELEAVDNEEHDDLGAVAKMFKATKQLKGDELLGYNVIEVGTLEGKPAVHVSDHGYAAYVRKK